MLRRKYFAPTTLPTGSLLCHFLILCVLFFVCVIFGFMGDISYRREIFDPIQIGIKFFGRSPLKNGFLTALSSVK